MSAVDWKPAAESLAADLRRVFGDRLRSLVAYGSHLDGDDHAPLTCLALVSTLTADDLHGCATHATRWARGHIATPLILPEHEFRRSLDAFPLEYGEIIRAHERVLGENPFVDLEIAPADLRRACETQIKSHLVHLREGYIESGGRPDAVAELVIASAPGFTALLRNVARLNGVMSSGSSQLDAQRPQQASEGESRGATSERPAEPREHRTSNRGDATHQGARAAGLPAHVVADILALEQTPGTAGVDAARLFPEYLAAVERLAGAVDGWRD
ncbi:MAG TPA: hypothetical protein VGF24_20500 [Vicinamibacterales bacterium]|jgi:hypothetical protein